MKRVTGRSSATGATRKPKCCVTHHCAHPAYLGLLESNVSLCCTFNLSKLSRVKTVFLKSFTCERLCFLPFIVGRVS
jgi:hypothetical protein